MSSGTEKPGYKFTSFRVRKGSISATAQARWDKLWPQFGQEVSDQSLNVAEWFHNNAPTVLDVGCGSGISTVGMARADPTVNIIGIDVYQPGLVQLLTSVAEHNINNVRVLRGNALVVLDKMFTDPQLTGIRIFFPDPWPKAKHHKRRIVNPENLKLMHSRLLPGGVVHIATDHSDYALAIREVIDKVTDYFIEVDSIHNAALLSSVPISVERPITKFQQKGIDAGRDIHDYILIKRPVS